MEQNNEQSNEQKQQFVCTGDCLACSKEQRQYCNCQMTYHLMRLLQTVPEAISSMAVAIEELKVKVAAIQGEGETVFKPELPPTETDTAQSGQRRKKVGSQDN